MTRNLILVLGENGIFYLFIGFVVDISQRHEGCMQLEKVKKCSEGCIHLNLEEACVIISIYIHVIYYITL